MTTSEEKTNELLEMWNGGMSIKAIAEELSLSETLIRAALKAHGLERLPGHNVSVSTDSNPADGEICARYQSGEPVPGILVEFGITYAILYGALARQGIPVRSIISAPAKTRRLDEAVTLYERGVELWKIKSETGIAQPTLHAELHRREIPLRRPRSRS